MVRHINEILQDIKAIEGFTKDADLARLFGVRQNVISTWRARNTVPYKELIALCEKEGWDISVLLSGQGALTKGESAEESASYSPEVQRYVDMLVEVLQQGDVVAVDVIKGEIAKEFRRLKQKDNRTPAKKGA